MKEIVSDENLKKYKTVIFDVDGTLYSLDQMHFYIFCEMFKYYFFHPWKYKELFIIRDFRHVREYLALAGVKNVNDQQFSLVAEHLQVDIGLVKKTVDFWINKRPLEYIRRCLRPKIKELIDRASSLGLILVYFSDYDPEPKVRRLGLKYDYFFNASSKQIDALKPSPKGVEYILQQLSLRAEDCLMIGDRQDKDGAAAIAAGLEYFIVN